MRPPPPHHLPQPTRRLRPSRRGLLPPPPLRLRARGRLRQGSLSSQPPQTPAKEPKHDGPKQLREQYEKLQAIHAQAEAKVKELELTYGATTKEKAEAMAKLAQAEEKLGLYEKRVKEEFEPLAKRYEETSKKLTEREEALRMRDYTATPEWHEKYVKPLADTHAEALQLINELVVTKEDGSQVQATAQELNYIIGAPNANEAARRADQLFGERSPFTPQLVNYRTKLRALETKRVEALEKAKVESEQWFQSQQQRQLDIQQALLRTLQESEKQHRMATEDPEEVAALSEGETFAKELDQLQQSGNVQAFGEKLGKARATLQNARVLELRVKRLQARISEQEAELQRLRGTEPQVETRTEGRAPELPEAAPLHERMGEGLMKFVTGRR